MRLIAIGLCTLALAAAPVLPREGDPVPGADVSAEESPGGIIVHFGNAADAKAACTAAHGSFTNTRGRIVCTNPGPEFRRSGVRLQGATATPTPATARPAG